jgi:hypothetical protein
VAGGLAVFEQSLGAIDEFECDFCVLVVGADFLFEAANSLFEAFKIGEHQLCLDHFGIGDRVDLSGDMDDVVIFETAQHISDSVAFADVGKELVAQTFSLGRTFHQPGDVDKREAGRDGLPGLADLGQLVEALIRHRDFAHIGLDGAKGKVRSLRGGGLCQGIEQCRFADIGQADDTAFETHEVLVIVFRYAENWLRLTSCKRECKSSQPCRQRAF